jgi:hypothetical protein
MTYVESQLAKDPKVSNVTLYEGAKKISRGIGKLSIRQFHAKYPLQVKRRRNRGRKRAPRTARRKRAVRPPAARTNGSAEAVRKIMLQFARELSVAESQVQTIEVLSKMDRYVVDILKAARG